MQHALVALQQEKSSSSSILIFVISLLGCPGPSIRSPPPSARHWLHDIIIIAQPLQSVRNLPQ